MSPHWPPNRIQRTPSPLQQAPTGMSWRLHQPRLSLGFTLEWTSRKNPSEVTAEAILFPSTVFLAWAVRFHPVLKIYLLSSSGGEATRLLQDRDVPPLVRSPHHLIWILTKAFTIMRTIHSHTHCPFVKQERIRAHHITVVWYNFIQAACPEGHLRRQEMNLH